MATNQIKIKRDRARELIEKRIIEGKKLISANITSDNTFKGFESTYKKWHEYNVDLLQTIFFGDNVINEYKHASGDTNMLPNPIFADPFPVKLGNYYETLNAKIIKLESILSRLDLFDELSTEKTKVRSNKKKEITNKVFIVHGHDNELKQTVARTLEKFKIQVIILHEQASKGKSILNKLDEYSDVDFAIVLLTPDDVGSSIEQSDKLNPRARQNVIFELGFFLGKLGFDKVIALKRGDIEIPSDYTGIIWIDYDDQNAWILELSKELKAAGFNID